MDSLYFVIYEKCCDVVLVGDLEVYLSFKLMSLYIVLCPVVRA